MNNEIPEFNVFPMICYMVYSENTHKSQFIKINFRNETKMIITLFIIKVVCKM